MPTRPLRPLARGAAAALLAAAAFGALGGSAAADPSTDPASLVNPLIGTSNGGNVFPGADTPFGMVQFSPDETTGNQTANANSSGYVSSANTIRGFSLAHVSGAGCAGLAGDVPFMPYVGDVTTSPAADVRDQTYVSTFSHSDETAQAGYYSVKLANGVTAELSTTPRTAAGQFTYPSSTRATMLIRTSAGLVGSTAANVTIDPVNQTVSGSVTSGNFCGNHGTPDQQSYYTLYFDARFSAAFTGFGTWQDETVSPGSTSSSGGTSYNGGSFGGVTSGQGSPTPGRGSGAYVQFDTTGNQQVNAQVGVSYVDAAGAAANLAAEQPDPPSPTSFATVRAAAHDAWNRRLSQVQVDGGTSDQQTEFYTALYHSLLHMNLVSDVDGRYWGMDQREHTLASGQGAQYGTFSGWDVYRSQIQLVSLLDPDVASDMAQSLYNQSTQFGGTWDRWTHLTGAVSDMAGDPSTAFVDTVEAFGGRSWDARDALASLVQAATVPTAADLSRTGWPNTVKGERPSLDQFLRDGYVPDPSNAWGGAGETLEDATADFSISDLAGRLGDTSTQSEFQTRSQDWMNIFNVDAAPADGAASGYMQNRGPDGTWPTFDRTSQTGFAEADGAQYVWNIPFNVAGLFQAMGGKAEAIRRLNAYFTNGDGSDSFVGGGALHPDLTNEPSMWAPWLFDWTGDPSRTQQLIREIDARLWTNTTGGIPGNDDLGAMSSWYVFSAMGMFPATPGRAEMELASPEFTSIVIRRSNGQTLTIKAPNAGTNGTYVRGTTLDGSSNDKTYLPESFVNDGRDHELDFDLTNAATSWGTDPADAPPSFSQGMAPALASVSTQALALAPGARARTNLDIQNTSDQDITVRLGDVSSSNLTVTMGESGSVTVPAGQRVSTPVTFTADAGASNGTNEQVDLPLTANGTSLERVIENVTIDTPQELSDLYDNVGQADDANPTEGAFDSTGHSFSIEALRTAGVTPGSDVRVSGFDFTWPNVAEGARDNYVVDGSRIQIDNGDGADRIGLLGSAASGPSPTTATVTYADGTTSQSPVTFGDWTSGNGNGQASAGNRRAIQTGHRVGPAGPDTTTAYVYSAAVPVTPGEIPVSVSIARPAAGTIHLFAMALDKRGPLPLDQLFDQVGIADNSNIGSISLDWTGHALSAEALADVGATPGGTVSADGLDYTWPNVQPGVADNMEVAGQEVALDPRDGVTKMGLLASAIRGPADTTAIVMYTDGTTSSTPLEVTDWTPTTDQANNTTVLDALYRTANGNVDTSAHADVYSVTFPIDSGRTPRWIRLTSPTSGNAAIHLFAIAEDGTVPGSGGGTPPGGGDGNGNPPGGGDNTGGGGNDNAGNPPAGGQTTTTAPATTPPASAPVTTTPKPPASKPAVKLVAPKVTKVAATSNGTSVTLTCATGATCKTTVTLTARLKVHGKLRTVTVGKATATIKAGKKQVISVTLNATGRKALSSAHKLKVTLKVSARAGSAKPRTTTKTVTLKAAKAKAKKH